MAKNGIKSTIFSKSPASHAESVAENISA